jgi:hypothetical protein
LAANFHQKKIAVRCAYTAAFAKSWLKNKMLALGETGALLRTPRASPQ